MEYVYDFVILLIWTGICAVLVYAFELLLGRFGYRRVPAAEQQGTHVPPPPPGLSCNR